MADQLTEEQIAEFKEAFSLFDKDGDGTSQICENYTDRFPLTHFSQPLEYSDSVHGIYSLPAYGKTQEEQL